MDEKEEVEEPKDSIQTLFLGFKKHPKKERQAKPEIEIVVERSKSPIQADPFQAMMSLNQQHTMVQKETR